MLATVLDYDLKIIQHNLAYADSMHKEKILAVLICKSKYVRLDGII